MVEALGPKYVPSETSFSFLSKVRRNLRNLMENRLQVSEERPRHARNHMIFNSSVVCYIICKANISNGVKLFMMYRVGLV